jgi:hypothetical protein
MDDSNESGHDFTPIAEALYQGRKIEAIKLYRELRGGGLKEAKDAVEQLEAALRQQSPDRFTSASRTGCLGCVLAVLAMIAAWRFL